MFNPFCPLSSSVVGLPVFFVCFVWFFLRIWFGVLFTAETYTQHSICPHSLWGFWSVLGLLLFLFWHLALFIFSQFSHYIITSACVYKVGRGPSLSKLLWTKGSLPFFLFTPCMIYTTAWGHEARLQTLDSAHLQWVTNYYDRNISSDSARLQWGTWFPWALNCVWFSFFNNPAPNQSTAALLNVNIVFMLLTQSEG